MSAFAYLHRFRVEFAHISLIENNNNNNNKINKMKTIHDLHVDLLLAIFARLGVRDLCTVDDGTGWQQ